MHEISAYVDDIYLQDDTKEKYIKNIVDTVALLRCLAFSLHTGKLQFLQIQQDLDILGFTINSINMTVSLTKEKKAQLSGLIRKTLNKKFIKNKKVWANNREIVVALLGWIKVSSTVCKKANVELFQESITELTWWRENLPTMFKKIREDPPTVNVYSDASNTGWGHIFSAEIHGISGHLKKNIIT